MTAPGRAAALALLAAIGTLGATYAIDRLRPPGQGALLPSFLPSPVEPLQAEIERLVEDNDGRADTRTLAIARDMLVRAPLAPTPLIIAADAALQDGRIVDARAASELALKRDPRNPVLHAWLAEDAAGRGDLESAVLKLQTLMRLDPSNRRQYLSALGVVAAHPAGQPLVEQALETAPGWGPQLTAELNKVHPDFEFLLRINRLAPTAQPGLLNRLLSERGVGAAHAAWLELLGDGAPPQSGWPYDPAFEGLPGAAPFNWRVLSDLADIEPTGGLYAGHDGRGQPRLIDQIVLLPPGAYQLKIAARTDARPQGGRLVWTLACLDRPQDLVRLELADTGRKDQTLSAPFEVPQDACEGQRLMLAGAPGEFTLWTRAEIGAVRIEPIQLSSTAQ